MITQPQSRLRPHSRTKAQAPRPQEKSRARAQVQHAKSRTQPQTRTQAQVQARTQAQANSHFTVPAFSKIAYQLRDHFESQFLDTTSPERFVWDYWYVADQYRLHRTPADYYFPERLWKTFKQQLIGFGRNELGCREV